MNVTPCCGKCYIYLDYKDAHQCGDGECACHAPNHITASRERIADNIQQHFFTNGATVSRRDYDHVTSTLLQHEAVVREEMARIVEQAKKPGGTGCGCYDWNNALNTAAQAVRTTPPAI